jgi:hypothetical protein
LTNVLVDEEDSNVFSLGKVLESRFNSRHWSFYGNSFECWRNCAAGARSRTGIDDEKVLPVLLVDVTNACEKESCDGVLGGCQSRSGKRCDTKTDLVANDSDEVTVLEGRARRHRLVGVVQDSSDRP